MTGKSESFVAHVTIKVVPVNVKVNDSSEFHSDSKQYTRKYIINY